MSDAPATPGTPATNTTTATFTTPPTTTATSSMPPAQEPAKTPPAKPDDSPKPGDPDKGGDEFKSPESKQAVLADLAREREARKALEARMDAQNKALMEAFGTAEPPKNEDDLAAQVKSIQEQIAADRRAALIDRLAAANGIDDDHKDLLTETDPERLKTQAEKVGALVKATKAAEEPPPFQPNPGQGQPPAAGTPEALTEAEYRQFYPTPST